MNLKSVLLLLFLVAIPTSLFSNTLYFPQVAFGGGYSTTFVIINTGTVPVASQVVFYDQGGNPRPEFTTPVNIAVASSLRFTIPNTASNTVVLWGQLDAGAGTVKGVATFDLRSSSGGLITTAGVLGADGGNSFLLPVDVVSNPAASTGVAIANVGTSSLSVRLRLIAENGLQSQTQNVLLGAHAQTAKFVTELFTISTLFKGTLIIEAPSGSPANTLAATALTVKENVLSALPVLPGGASQTGGNTLYFPQVAYGGGYSTNFVVMNTGSNQVDSVVNFYNQAGINQPALTMQVSIPVGGSTRFNIPNTGSTTNVVWGELISQNSVVKGVATFDLRNSAGGLITTAGVLGIEAGNSFTLPVDVTATGSTGIAIANVTNGQTVYVRLRLLNEDGSGAGAVTSALSAASGGGFEAQKEFELNPFSSRAQVADFITTWFPQLNGTVFKGAVVVEVFNSSAAALAATALTVKEGVLSALPVLPGSITGTGGTGGTGGGGTGGGGTGGGGTGGGGTGGGGTGGGGTGGGGTGGGGTGGGGTGGGGGTTSGPASACFNSALGSSATVHAEYGISGTGANSFSGSAIYDYSSTPNVSFEGQSLTETKATVLTTFTAPVSFTSTIKSSSYGKLDGMDVLTYGNTAELTTPIAGTSKSVNTPPVRDRRYSLAVGETYTMNYSVTTTSTFTGLPSTTTTAPGSLVIKYLGHEMVTSPAGTFDTCKFIYNNDASSTTWEAVGSGILIKSSATDNAGSITILMLNTGTINGSTIRP